MVEKVEKLIIEWIKSDNENATHIANKICDLIDVKAHIIKKMREERYLAERRGNKEVLRGQSGEMDYGMANGLDRAIVIVKHYYGIS